MSLSLDIMGEIVSFFQRSQMEEWLEASALLRSAFAHRLSNSSTDSRAQSYRGDSFSPIHKKNTKKRFITRGGVSFGFISALVLHSISLYFYFCGVRLGCFFFFSIFSCFLGRLLHHYKVWVWVWVWVSVWVWVWARLGTGNLELVAGLGWATCGENNGVFVDFSLLDGFALLCHYRNLYLIFTIGSNTGRR